MSAQVVLTHTADKAQRKLDKPLRLMILQALMDISQNPENKGEKLTQPLTGVYSHHIRWKGREFRIAYQYNVSTDCVVILLIAPHENFYKRVKNLLDAIGA
jgi:mRNA-degrading endonuclease RelE of RelBE toxin-antitoxin system